MTEDLELKYEILLNAFKALERHTNQCAFCNVMQESKAARCDRYLRVEGDKVKRKEIYCKHEFGDMVYSTNPPQIQCVKCGVCKTI